MLQLVNDRRRLCSLHCLENLAMTTITSLLIALLVFAGIAAPASALDAKSFYEQADRASH
jgi:hypothetical protein